LYEDFEAENDQKKRKKKGKRKRPIGVYGKRTGQPSITGILHQMLRRGGKKRRETPAGDP